MSLDKKRTWGRFSSERDGSSSETDEDVKKSDRKDTLAESSDDDQAYYPLLPPNMLKPKFIPGNNKNQTTVAFPMQTSPRESSDEKPVIGPVLPLNLLQNKTEEHSGNKKIIGPVAPSSAASCNEDSSKEDNFVEGPMLPPHLLNKKHTIQTNEIEPQHVAGPATPAHLLKRNRSPEGSEGPCLAPATSRRILGPELPPGFTPAASSSEEEDDDAIGPDPRLMTSEGTSGGIEINERAERTKRKILGLDKEEKVERESWMLELPPERAANIGLGPRQFRQKLAPDLGDRTVWTDTPSDTIKKQKLPPKLDDKALLRQKELAKRDRMMEKMTKKAEKHKRKESLLEMHTKKLKEKAKKEKETSGPPERKRFNREEDMQVNRFDEAQKKAIFKRAQLLNDRFSSGESKYL